jgi:arginine N-succinyltransferase
MMAEHPHRFSETVFAEMRGVSDDDGNSPFWQWLQGFIADLMPKLPIYINLLSKEAQAVIGQVHENTVPALKLLKKEGFVCRDYVDIFDAGPTVECDLVNIVSVRDSFKAKVKVKEHTSSQEYLMINTSFENFRGVAAKGAYDKAEDTVILSAEVASALNVGEGDYVRMLAQ